MEQEPKSVSYKEILGFISGQEMTPKDALNAILLWTEQQKAKGIVIDYKGLDEDLKAELDAENERRLKEEQKNQNETLDGLEEGYGYDSYDSMVDSPYDDKNRSEGARESSYQKFDESYNLEKLYANDVQNVSKGLNYTAEEEAELIRDYRKKVDLEAYSKQLKKEITSLKRAETQLDIQYRNAVNSNALTSTIQSLEKDRKSVKDQLVIKEKEQRKELERLNKPENKRIIRLGQRAGMIFIYSQMANVVQIAKKYQGRGMDMLDIIQTGNEELVKAVYRYDPLKYKKHDSESFKKYASISIEQRIKGKLLENSQKIKVGPELSQKIREYKQVEGMLSLEKGREPTDKEIMEGMNDRINERAAKAFLGQDQDPYYIQMAAQDIKAYKIIKNPLATKEEYDQAKETLQSAAKERDISVGEMINNLSMNLNNIRVDGRTGAWQEKYGDITPYDLSEIRLAIQPMQSLDKKLGNEEKTALGDLIADQHMTPEEIAIQKEEKQIEDPKQKMIHDIMQGKDFTPEMRQVIGLSFGFEDNEPHTSRYIAAKLYGKNNEYEVTDEEIQKIEQTKAKGMDLIKEKMVKAVEKLGSKSEEERKIPGKKVVIVQSPVKGKGLAM